MFSKLHSGKPVILVSSDNIPASMDVEITNFVSICPSTVTVPIVAMVVKVTPEAYNALVEIYNESTLSLKQIASLLIVKAAEQVVYDKE